MKRLLPALALAGVFLCSPAHAYDARMYGMTGLLGRVFNFSGGVDTAMAEVVKKHPTVKTYPRRHIDKWRVLETAAANYKRDKLPIILSGHSMGADAAIWIAHRLNERGIPVAAIFSYDPTPLVACVPSNVQVILSWRNTLPAQLGGGRVEWCKKPSDPSRMARYDLRDFHTNIDDRKDVHALTVKHVGDVIHMLAEMEEGK
jgi:pimeloyl-ACP methyl ester carboxylesterase